MSEKQNRNKVIERVQREIIGPGSDIFVCNKDFTDEIIEGKPLQRYFSAILFPKQLQPNASDNGELEINEGDSNNVTDLFSDLRENTDEVIKENEIFETD